MTLKSRHAACERARVWATLLPDGELSTFEQRLLDAHCAHCVDCRDVLESVSGLTAIVRDTPHVSMERRVRVVQPRPAYWRSWRSVSGALATCGAAAFALALAFWVGPEHTRLPKAPVSTTPVIIVTPQNSSADVRGIWQLKHARTGTAPDSNAAHHPGAILT